tara:strand:+ start:173 stop:382 length:210 start_codon:yes stop_codon:yes gene_type:complete
MNWQNKVYDKLCENKFVPVVGGGRPSKPSKPSTSVSIVTIDGKKMVVRKDADGKVISRTPAQPLPKKRS